MAESDRCRRFRRFRLTPAHTGLLRPIPAYSGPYRLIPADPWLTVLENIGFGTRYRGDIDLAAKDEISRYYLNLVGLDMGER